MSLILFIMGTDICWSGLLAEHTMSGSFVQRGEPAIVDKWTPGPDGFVVE